MTYSSSNIDDELIARYLAGETNAEEHKKVELWLAASEVNRADFTRVKALWDRTGKVIPDEAIEVDVDRGWAGFQAKVRSRNFKNTQPLVARTRSIFYYTARVAAILIVGFVVYLVYQNFIKVSVQNVELISSNGVKSDMLPDGSFFSLNAQSQLIFPEKFKSAKRLVALKGEAFFQVTRDEEKPFVVETEGATITVLGTSFYVNAYDSLNVIEVGVEEGRVKVAGFGEELILNAGGRAVIDKITGKVDSSIPYEANELFWKSETLVFKNETLLEVFATLEKAYNIKVNLENSQIANCRLTGKFYKETVEHILEIIKTNFDLSIEYGEGGFVIAGNGCD